MRRNTIALATAALAAAGVVGVTGATLAAADESTATPSPSATSPSAPGGGTAGCPGGSPDAAVTGAEADKVIAAVEAEDSAVTITAVRKDPDGSYDALGTKAGGPVSFDVSADLETVTAATGGPRGGHGGPGGPGGSRDAAVTGAEADKVIAAVEAEDSAVTITAVRKDPDGSYDALGTKAGGPVFFDVSADLKTVTPATGGPHGGPHGGPGGGPDGSGARGGAGTMQGGSGSGSSSTDPTDANAAYAV